MTIEITRKQACELIRSHIGKEQTLTDEDIARISFAVNNDMQVRDFLLGLPAYYDMQQVIDFLCYMAEVTPMNQDAPFVTVGAAIAYEVGNMEQFYKHVGYVATHHTQYSLNKMLMSARASGFPGAQLSKMREELHIKVMKVCYQEEPDFVIEETENKGGQHISTTTDLSSGSENSGQEETGQAKS